jgi:hypothetical protein
MVMQKGCTRLTTASEKAYHGRWFSPGTPACSTSKIDCHDIAEILLKVELKHQKSNQINAYQGPPTMGCESRAPFCNIQSRARTHAYW